VLDLLAHLVDKSLVNARPDVQGGVRYSLLETVRQYGREALTVEETERLRSQHLQYFTSLAERAEAHLLTSEQEWLDAIEREHDNLREALECAKDARDASQLLRIVGSVWMFWMVRCFLSEGRGWGNAAVQRSDDAEPALRAKVLAGVARLTWTQGDHRRAASLSQRCLELQTQPGSAAWPVVLALQLLGNCCQYYLDDLPRALEHHERALGVARESGQRWLLALQLVNLGEAVQASGESERATRLFEEGFTLASAVGDRWVAALALGNLASGALLAHDLEGAEFHFARSVMLRKELQDRRGLAGCLEGIAMLAQLKGQPERAARLFGAAESQRQAIGASLTFVLTRVDADRSVDALIAELGEARCSSLWKEGRLMVLDEALQEALEGLGGPRKDTVV
jgi:non-specific serine/threonine protein kinase